MPSPRQKRELISVLVLLLYDSYGSATHTVIKEEWQYFTVIGGTGGTYAYIPALHHFMCGAGAKMAVLRQKQELISVLVLLLYDSYGSATHTVIKEEWQYFTVIGGTGGTDAYIPALHHVWCRRQNSRSAAETGTNLFVGSIII
jgi:cellobiose-specific phosphotransferase system component IIC